eukprot:COSAG06_NODE_21166_length_767_cov_1.113772_1_plen_58_part_01
MRRHAALLLLFGGLLGSVAQTASRGDDGLTDTERQLRASQLPGFRAPRVTRPMVDPDT